MMPRKIKIFWLAGLALMLLIPAAVIAVRLWPRMEGGGLYCTYADVPGIDATFLHGFPLNDTLTVDVTLLHASDSAGWERLKKDFNITDYPPEALPYIDPESPEFYYAPKRDHSLGKDSVLANNDYISVSRSKQEVFVFDIQFEEQVKAILHYKLNKFITE